AFSLLGPAQSKKADPKKPVPLDPKRLKVGQVGCFGELYRDGWSAARFLIVEVLSDTEMILDFPHAGKGYLLHLKNFPTKRFAANSTINLTDRDVFEVAERTKRDGKPCFVAELVPLPKRKYDPLFLHSLKVGAVGVLKDYERKVLGSGVEARVADIGWVRWD